MCGYAVVRGSGRSEVGLAEDWGNERWRTRRIVANRRQQGELR